IADEASLFSFGGFSNGVRAGWRWRGAGAVRRLPEHAVERLLRHAVEVVEVESRGQRAVGGGVGIAFEQVHLLGQRGEGLAVKGGGAEGVVHRRRERIEEAERV